MVIDMRAPEVAELGTVVEALRDWQDDASPIQLHPGDVGWHWCRGAEATAASLRTWGRGGRLLAIGLLDGPGVLRLTVAPEAWGEEELARQVVADLAEPQQGVLPAGKAAVEAPDGTRVKSLLSDVGWSVGEAWTPLTLDLAAPVEVSRLRTVVVGPAQVSEFTSVHRSAWGSARFTDEVWRTMASGLPYADARCLLGYDDQGVAVAGATVWSAGPGKPGLLEPVGVHAEHRGRGYGTAITLAAAAGLQALGSSSAWVCTPSALLPAVAAYASAGFRRLPERLDRLRTVGA